MQAPATGTSLPASSSRRLLNGQPSSTLPIIFFADIISATDSSIDDGDPLRGHPKIKYQLRGINNELTNLSMDSPKLPPMVQRGSN